MSKTARVPEPSMEEILASIRRIIADDSGAPAQPATQHAPASAPQRTPPREAQEIDALMSAQPQPVADVLDLTDPVDSTPPAFTPVRGPDVTFREEDRQPPPLQAVTPPPPAPPALAPAAVAPRASSRDDQLLSAHSTAAVSSAFNSLAATVLSEHSRTLEDIVKEMMRPMLKNWLDDNLPNLVERIVRAEIERVARGGR
jgi:cell pole-organizing protein PopZ